VLWEKLNALVREMKVRFADTAAFEARAYADTGPIHERAAAKYAGLGWLGKKYAADQPNGRFLAVPRDDSDHTSAGPTLGADQLPPPDRCGSCRACLEACPTGAIVEPYVLDATRCIAYLTIEFKGSISEDLREAAGRHVLGCDICQDVCPWNRKSPRTDAAEFEPRVFARVAENSPDSLFIAGSGQTGQPG
jgi:epoxyqueuosine reductase